jgi:hypothetical protein
MTASQVSRAVVRGGAIVALGMHPCESKRWLLIEHLFAIINVPTVV